MVVSQATSSILAVIVVVCFLIRATVAADISSPAFGMSPKFYADFVLRSYVAGTQLSSYVSFLSKNNMAFSILLTSSSTIASVLITPFLTSLLISLVVPADAVAMAKSILQVVLLPVALGLVLNTSVF
ncbi:probable sodium/metabolite cotransporter BASS3, chloroplastic [Solanum lycopersicum]